jgi:hypothetical protein
MALAYTHGVPRRRMEEVIDLAGLRAVAHKRVGAFSLGMGQRLGIAAVLLAGTLRPGVHSPDVHTLHAAGRRSRAVRHRGVVHGSRLKVPEKSQRE